LQATVDLGREHAEIGAEFTAWMQERELALTE